MNLNNKQISSFEGIPNIPNAKLIILTGNRISSIPSIINLPNLAWLHLQSNQITSLPNNIQGLPNLSNLSLHFNPLQPKNIDGSLIPVQEQILQLQNNMNASKSVDQEQLQISY